MALSLLDPDVQEQLKMMNQPSEEDKAAARSQALLSLGLGMMANSTGPRGYTGLGQIVGRAGLGSMDDYQRSLMMAQQKRQQEFQTGLALQKLSDEQRIRKAQQSYLQSNPNIPEEVRAGVVPFSDWWKRQNPEDAYKTVGDSLVRITPKGAESVFQNKKAPDGFEYDQNGQLAPIGAYWDQKVRVAKAGASNTNVLMDNLGLKPKDRFEMEDKLRGDYSKATDLDNKVLGISAKMRAILAGDPNAMKDQATIYSFAKMLDPDGAVRESDYAAIMNTAGLADRLKNYVSKMQTGQVLSDKQRQEMAGIINDWESVAKRRIQSQQSTFSGRAKMYNLTPENIYQPMQNESQVQNMPKSKSVKLDDGKSVLATLGDDGKYYTTVGGKKYRVEE